MMLTSQQLEEMAKAVPFWFHSIELGQGVITNGWKTQAMLAEEIERLKIPDLRGKSVLDINAWDGFYSFEAERRGAARVVALDQYMWAMDLGEHHKYWKECKERGTTPAPYHTMPYYKPDELPGKIGFDTAHAALRSKVEVVIGDFMEMELEPLGTFDVVFYFGSLYHMENPLQAMRRVAAITKEMAVIETEAVAFPNLEHRAVCEFFPSDELDGDVSNWWSPNEKALVGLCQAAGFSHVDVVNGSPLKSSAGPRSLGARLRSAGGQALRSISTKREAAMPDSIRYRAVAHARK